MEDVDLLKKKSIGSIIFNIAIVGLTILILGFAINFYYSIGYLLILIVHEMGHYIVAKVLKLKVKFGGFTPFGAYIVHEKTVRCKENSIIALGGPLFGGVLGVVYYLIYYFTLNNTFLVLSLTSIFLNLLNMIPVKPLDGGQVVESISPIVCYVGFPIIIYLFVSASSLKIKIILLFMTLVGIYQTHEFRVNYKKDDYYRLDKKDKMKFILVYIGLILLLGVSSIILCNTYDFKILIKGISRFN